ncbi:MAG: HAMP domain-containing histidine kinase [Candidatus Cloacimonetes bacterium]|nr:HAMP domain-containing histidine kinase [Candidatus Cloacimonadota bacterium]
MRSWGYPNEYSQVILNILNNAKDAILEKETKNAKVQLMLDQKDGRTILTIWDNAGSIPNNIIDKVFDPYFTTKQHQKGTGLGLYMAKTIIENNMDGSIQVKNIDGGVKFIIEV